MHTVFLDDQNTTTQRPIWDLRLRRKFVSSRSQFTKTFFKIETLLKRGEESEMGELGSRSLVSSISTKEVFLLGIKFVETLTP